MKVRGLGYVGLQGPDPKRWLDFATNVCGLEPARSVPSSRSTEYCSGVRRFFHSSGLRTSFSIFTGSAGAACAVRCISLSAPESCSNTMRS